MIVSLSSHPRSQPSARLRATSRVSFAPNRYPPQPFSMSAVRMNSSRLAGTFALKSRSPANSILLSPTGATFYSVLGFIKNSPFFNLDPLTTNQYQHVRCGTGLFLLVTNYYPFGS